MQTSASGSWEGGARNAGSNVGDGNGWEWSGQGVPVLMETKNVARSETGQVGVELAQDKEWKHDIERVETRAQREIGRG